MRIKTTHAVLLCAVLALPAFGAPPNLVKGGSFDTYTDLKFWGNPFMGMDWQGVDAQSRPDSGSATLARREGGVSQCVAVTGGRFYDFGARVLLTSSGGRPAAAVAYMQIDFSPALAVPPFACLGQPLATVQTNRAVGSPNGRFQALAGHVFAPEEAHSALVTLFNIDRKAPYVNGGDPALFDDVFLQESGGCAADDTTLCLSGGVSARGSTPSTTRAAGTRLPSSSSPSTAVTFTPTARTTRR